MHLKEMKYLERICEKVGSINVTGNGDILKQLLSLVAEKQKKASALSGASCVC